MDPVRAFGGRRLALGLLMLALAACGDGAPTDPPTDPPGGTGAPATLAVTPGALAFDALGDSAQLAAAVRDSAGVAVAGAVVLWASLDPTVATVSRSGWVRALDNGTAGVVARAGGAADTVAVTVAQAVATLEVSPSAVSVGEGDTVRLVAAVADSNGAAVEGAAVAWTSADERVATVDGSGLVTGVGRGGETRITAAAGGVSDEVAVAVPDQILFISNRDGNDELYLMNADGSGQTRLTEQSRPEFAAVWSPDGTKIAFVRRDDIWVMNADGSTERNRTNGDGRNSSPVWSPDGRRIAFVSDRGGDDGNIYVMNADGSVQSNRSNNPSGYGDSTPAWSPDGTKIAFIRRDGDFNYEVWVMNTDGSVQKPLAHTHTPDHHVVLVWSPDGLRIALIKYPGDIWVINVDGFGQKNLTNGDGDNSSPAWSPDGRRIAFVSDRGGDDDIWVVNADGYGGPANLTNDPGIDSAPAWSPDGTKIAFHSDRDSRVLGFFDVYVMNADGSEVVNVTKNSRHDRFPAWRPRP